jgi:hypothetical protein
MPRNKLPTDQLVRGRVYQIDSRNLTVGVFDGARGFIGIREKLGDRFLFKEYLADGGAFGTVWPQAEIGICPPEIELKESGPSRDQITGRLVGFDRPVADGGKGWYFLDTGESSQAIRAYSELNRQLFDFLKAFENQ